MEVVGKENTQKKLSYEELENIAQQLSVQAQQLQQKNQELVKLLNENNAESFFKRLDWLWRVVCSDTPYITNEFKTKAGEEFMKLMSSPEEEPEEPEK